MAAFTDQELLERIASARKLAESTSGKYFHNPNNKDSQFTQLQQTQLRLADTFQELLELRKLNRTHVD